MRTRWTFLIGLDGRVGVRVWVFRRAGRRWEVISLLLVPTIHETRLLAVRGLLQAVLDGMPSVLTHAELVGAVKGKWGEEWA